jgi:hypothetical protein
MSSVFLTFYCTYNFHALLLIAYNCCCVQEGRVPDIPQEYKEKYPEYVELIRICCRQNPNKRPSFQALINKLKQCKKKYEALKN